MSDAALTKAIAHIPPEQQTVVIQHVQSLELRLQQVEEQLKEQQQALEDSETQLNKISQDQLQLEQAKEELTQSEKRYRDFIEMAPVGTIRIDLAGNIAFASTYAEEIFGFERHEYLNQPVIDRVHPEDQAHFFSLLQLFFQNEDRRLAAELRGIKKDGSTVWIRGVGQVILDANDRPSSLLISFLDATEAKQAQLLLVEREALYQSLVKNAMEGIDILDVTGYRPLTNEKVTLLIRNERMKYILQDATKSFTTAEEVTTIAAPQQTGGRTAKEVFYAAAHRLVEKGRNRDILRIQHPNGIKLDVEAQEQILEVNGKKIMIRFYQDITQRLRQEELIEQQLLQLNEQNTNMQTYIQSNMQLENFAYIASHDLRAPIRNVVSFSNLLEKKAKHKLSEEEQDFLKYIVDSANHMKALIEDLLTFSRANTEKRKLRQVELQPLYKKISHEFGAQCTTLHADLNFPEGEQSIIADPIKLYQLLQNLIGNALKFVVADRKPVIQVQLNESKKYWTFSIRDNGIGIPEEFQDKIFLIFKRLHSQEAYEGTGIGLAICKKLVDQHKGKIWVESIPDQGSTFHFTIAKKI